MPGMQAYKNKLVSLLSEKGIEARFSGQELICLPDFALDISHFFDLVVREPQKIAALVQSKLGLNTRVFARNCVVKKITKPDAEVFLDQYHIMRSTQSAANYGLFLKDELIAVASFSKGRKMNRLASHERSFELIRFCCKDGITVTGGLTKLVKNFCRDKQAGDVMTYVDRQFSNGQAFVKAGFKKLDETAPNYFLVNKNDFERSPVENKDIAFDAERFYLTQNAGNIKLIYTPNEPL